MGAIRQTSVRVEIIIIIVDCVVAKVKQEADQRLFCNALFLFCYLFCTAAVPTTYPVGGYVNMNQLAHMALQHQGLCPADKKHDHDDLGHEQSPAGAYRADHFEDFDPRGQRPYPPPIDNAGIGKFYHVSMLEYRSYIN